MQLERDVLALNGELDIKKKPGAETPGKSAKTGDIVPPILAEPPYHASDKNTLQATTAMSNHNDTGFTKIANSLRDHPAYRTAKPKHRYIFLELLLRAAWEPTTYPYYGIGYPQKRGQVFFTIRGLAKELTWEGTAEDKITRHDIDGCITFFSRCKMLGQELGHPFSAITILYSSFCDEEKIYGRTGARTELGQSSDSLKDILDTKDKKKRGRERKAAGAATPPPDSSKLCFGEEGLVKLTQVQYEKLLAEVGEEGTQWMIQKLGAKIPNIDKAYKSHFHTMCKTGWVRDEWIKHSQNGIQTAKAKRYTVLDLFREYKFPESFDEWVVEFGMVKGRAHGSGGSTEYSFLIDDIETARQWLDKRKYIIRR
jgi:hypothetical protein